MALVVLLKMAAPIFVWPINPLPYVQTALALLALLDYFDISSWRAPVFVGLKLDKRGVQLDCK